MKQLFSIVSPLPLKTPLLMSVGTNLLQRLSPLPAERAYAPCTACLFSTSPVLETIKKKRKVKKRIDPYRAAQARQRKLANQARQVVLSEERRAAMGDPVRPKPTPFLESLFRGSSTGFRTSAEHQEIKNFLIETDEFRSSLEYSKELTEPQPPEDPNYADPRVERLKAQTHKESHENAERALSAIAAIENGNSKDRTRINVQRCIAEFGRHNTDSVLAPTTASLGQVSLGSETQDASKAAIPKRVGPDTGSSEVQVAILTTKINTLADDLHNKDKHNKRNLRLLVHKRQKLLAYLRRKERAGPRWQNLVEKLGIGDAMWKGEISL